MNHHHILHRISLLPNRIGGVMVNMLASSEVDRGFEPRSGQINDYKIDICCFFTKHEALGRKSKDLLDRNQDNVSEWGDMHTRRLPLHHRCGSVIMIFDAKYDDDSF
jgi:hypothetical protein